MSSPLASGISTALIAMTGMYSAAKKLDGPLMCTIAVTRARSNTAWL